MAPSAIAERVAEQTPAGMYARSKRTPRSASESMFGVVREPGYGDCGASASLNAGACLLSQIFLAEPSKQKILRSSPALPLM
jgi:hypothetical protein